MKISIKTDHHWLKIHSELLQNTYHDFFGESIINASIELSLEEALYRAPFALLSHGTQTDPIFNYANLQAQTLWEMDWNTFTQTPSRLSAAPVEQSVRQQFMDNVRAQGFVDNYEGIRISKTGKRFYIKNVRVWNLYDKEGTYVGQAALINNWKPCFD